MFPFNSKPKRRWLFEKSYGTTRVRLASIITGRDLEYGIFFYKMEKFNVPKLFASIKFTDLTVCKDLLKDVEMFVKEMMR